MTDDSENQIIYCPYCKTSIAVDKLGEYVNANQYTKKQAIEERLQLWSEVYDRNFLIQNVVVSPDCARTSHLGDWLG